MFKHDLVTAFRSLSRHKMLALIYVSGLSISIAAGMLILIWVNYQYSFDKDTKNARSIYRVYPRVLMNGNDFTSAMAPPPLEHFLKSNFPEVLAATRLYKYDNNSVSRNEDGKPVKTFSEEIYQADSTFFNVFTFKMLQGNAGTALTKPSSVVITKSTAIKYFGEQALNSGNVLGKTLDLSIGLWKLHCNITGITDDVPANAHFHYKIILSDITDPWTWSVVWVDNTYYTYIRLRDGTDPALFEKKVAEAVKPHIDPQLQTTFGTSYDALIAKGGYWQYKLQPITDIHLHSGFERELEPGQNISSVYILGAAAILLLAMACINYTNLSTARSIRRSKEIGVRKTLGSSRSRLLALVFTETGMVCLISGLLSAVLLLLLIRPFEDLMHTELPWRTVVNPMNGLMFVGLLSLVGILGGIYPSFYLSSFNVVKAVKGGITPGRRIMNFKSVLLVAQFFMFIGLAICAILVNRQLSYLRGRSPGFDKENVVILHDPGSQLDKKSDAFIAELKKDPDILSANVCADYPGSGYDNFPISATYKAGTPEHLLANVCASYDFLGTFGIKLLQGRDFNRQTDNDTIHRVILNEAAVKQLGIDNPVGSVINTKYLNSLDIKTTRYEVIGVTDNFNFRSLHNTIQPIAIFLGRSGQYLAIRTTGRNITRSIETMNKTWNDFAPRSPFEYQFLDESIDHLYKSEAVLSNILGILTALIILVAIIGLAGLTMLTVQQRTKEIGIRKAIGASTYNILLLFSKEHLKWVAVAFTLAVPVAWLVMQRWLHNFAYHVDVSWWIFPVAGAVAVVVALLVVGILAGKAANESTVKALKSE